MSIEVRVAEKDELENWDVLIESSPHGTIFHTLDWLKIVEKHTDSKLYPLIGLKNEEIVELFPIFYRKRGPLKMVFSPPPKVGIPYMGPVLLGYDRLKQEKKESLSIGVHTEVDRFICEEIKPNYIYFKSPLMDCRSFKWLEYQANPLYSYILDLSVGLSNLEYNFSGSARKNIRKAEKDGMILEFGSKEELEVLYDLLYDRYVNQEKIIPISKNYLLDIFNIFFPNNLKVFIVRHQDNVISGGIKLCYKDRIIDWIGQPKTNMRTSNDFLHREVIRWGAENGYHYYEILGANTQSICKFKSKFNPALSMYFEIKKSTISGIIAEKLYTKLKNYL